MNIEVKYYLLLGFIILMLTSYHLYAQNNIIKGACIGNSVTYGYGLKNSNIESYPSQLQQLLKEKYEVKNIGHSGATLLKKGHNPYYKTKAFADAAAFKPDIAIIHLGLNYTDPRNWPNYKDEFEEDYAWLLDTLKTLNSLVKLYICKLTPIFSGHPRFKSGTRNWYWQIQNIFMIKSMANGSATCTGIEALRKPLKGIYLKARFIYHGRSGIVCRC